jgi:hypothetical protein
VTFARVVTAVRRGATRRCPHCGKGALFRGWAHHALGLIAIGILGALLVITAPNRWGIGIALHYLSRLVWPDPADPVPPLPASDQHEP